MNGSCHNIRAATKFDNRFCSIVRSDGTIHKTMSAYDMTFSDAIYGRANRYVSRVRLQKMLDHEYDLLIERLDRKFSNEKTFLVFADTIAARSFKDRNESHGRLGVLCQYQSRPQPST